MLDLTHIPNHFILLNGAASPVPYTNDYSRCNSIEDLHRELADVIQLRLNLETKWKACKKKRNEYKCRDHNDLYKQQRLYRFYLSNQHDKLLSDMWCHQQQWMCTAGTIKSKSSNRKADSFDIILLCCHSNHFLLLKLKHIYQFIMIARRE